MDLYVQIYEFASSAGALEGYVYRRQGLDPKSLENWIGHLVKAYELLPAEERHLLQPSIDQTIGRAVRSLEGLSGPEAERLASVLRAVVKGPMPASPDDFQKQKWFE
ncbi:conserved hypothetical protein [uncultured Desulfatiglans sp.]|nr:conserved hypothetical protein [uncultured Desulfatiglans sp.]